MALSDIGNALRRFWQLALVVMLVWNAIGLALIGLRPASYEATTTLIVEPSGPRSDFNSVEVVRFLLPSVAEQVRTPGFAKELREKLPPATRDDLGGVTADIEPGTGIVRINGKSPDPEAAQAIADTAAGILIERKLSKRFEIAILSPAGTPSRPSDFPLLFSSTALGLILGIAAALIASALRPRFKDADEIEDRLGLRVFGEIPVTGQRMLKSPPELFNGRGNWRAANAYQRLGVNLETALAPNGASAIAVTSFGTGEGKTTVTANLAWAMALLRQPVVGIDGDLRQPALHRYFDLQPTNGTGYPKPEPTENPWLTIVPAGRPNRDATEVLNAELPDLLGEYRDRLVLVDTPAITDRADATLIASIARTALLVVDIRARHPAQVERAVHDLRRVGVDVLGIVVNRSRARV